MGYESGGEALAKTGVSVFVATGTALHALGLFCSVWWALTHSDCCFWYSGWVATQVKRGKRQGRGSVEGEAGGGEAEAGGGGGGEGDESMDRVWRFPLMFRLRVALVDHISQRSLQEGCNFEGFGRGIRRAA